MNMIKSWIISWCWESSIFGTLNSIRPSVATLSYSALYTSRNDHRQFSGLLCRLLQQRSWWVLHSQPCCRNRRTLISDQAQVHQFVPLCCNFLNQDVIFAPAAEQRPHPTPTPSCLIKHLTLQSSLSCTVKGRGCCGDSQDNRASSSNLTGSYWGRYFVLCLSHVWQDYAL